MPTDERFRSSVLAGLVASLVLVHAACSCHEHPLYDHDINQFDTWYLGNANTQRPYPGGPQPDETDPDPVHIDVAVELRQREGVDEAVLRALWTGDEGDHDLTGELLAGDGSQIGVFQPVGGDVWELALDARELEGRLGVGLQAAFRCDEEELVLALDEELARGLASARVEAGVKQ